jgi:hypothetical protein
MAQYQSCLQQQLSVSPQESAKIVPILANEGRKVIAIRNNNLLSNVQKIQEVKTPIRLIYAGIFSRAYRSARDIQTSSSRNFFTRPM